MCAAVPTSLRLSVDVEAFRADPIGACLVGRTWLHFCWSSHLWGLVFFGRPDRQDALVLAHSLGIELGAGIAPHAFYLDARHLDGVDPDAFGELIALYRDNHVRASALYTRLGLVIREGVEGAVVTGFYGSQDPPFPFRVLEDPASACEWLGAPMELDDHLAAIVAGQRGAATIVITLRNLLTAENAPDTPAPIARALGMSPRTLQRRLREAGTSLHKERAGFRVEAAKKRLVETNTPVTVIALDLGFATPQHFSRQFRETTGVAPSEWRKRFRRPR